MMNTQKKKTKKKETIGELKKKFRDDYREYMKKRKEELKKQEAIADNKKISFKKTKIKLKPKQYFEVKQDGERI